MECANHHRFDNRVSPRKKMKKFVGSLQTFVGVMLFALNPTTLLAQPQVHCVNCANTEHAHKIITAIKGASTANARAVSESMRIVSETAALTESRMERSRIAAKYDLTDPCSVTVQGRGNVIEIERQRGLATGKNTGKPSASTGASAAMQKALSIAEGNQMAPSPEVIAALATSGACSSFVKGGERQRLCNAAFSSDQGVSTGQVVSGFPNADVRAETLFDGPQSTSDLTKGLVRHFTIPAGDSKERTAYAAFMRNIDTPLDLRALFNKEANSTSGRNYMALRDSYEGVMSLATKPLRDQERMMLETKESLSAVNQMIAGDNKMGSTFVKDWLNAAYPAWASKGVSLLELMNLEVVRRYKNEKWYIRMAQEDARNIAVESVSIQALQAWQNNILLERQQQTNILLGAIAGVLLRQEKMPQLISAHKAAQVQ